MDKLLTILVPSYNMELFLPKCLGSLLIRDKCLFSKLDVIVINDGSTDKTSEIAHGFADRYLNVFRVIDKTNGHYGSCINCGLVEARGKFIKVLDADDWFDTEILPEYLKYLEILEGVDLVATDYKNVDETGRILEQVVLGLESNRTINVEDYVRVRRYDQMHVMTYRTSLLRDMGYSQLEGISYTDTEWTFLPLVKVRVVRYFPKVLYVRLLGRAGQSVDPAVMERDYWMRGELTLDLAKKYMDVCCEATPGVDSILLHRLVSMIASIYRYGIIKGAVSPKFDILQFDKRLCSVAPKLFTLSASTAYLSVFGYPLVCAWRERWKTLRPMILLYKLVAVVKRGNAWLHSRIVKI